MRQASKVLDKHTGKLYESARSAASVFHVTPVRIRKLCREGRRFEYVDPDVDKESLCWNCNNLFCSWVQLAEPVMGWLAMENPSRGSYRVLACPEYKKERDRGKAYGEQCQELAIEVVTQAVRDWKDDPGLRKELRRFFGSEWFKFLLKETEIDQDMIIERLKKL